MESEGEGEKVNESEEGQSEGNEERASKAKRRVGRADRAMPLGKLQGISDANVSLSDVWVSLFRGSNPICNLVYFPSSSTAATVLGTVPQSYTAMELLGIDPRSEERSALSQALSLPPWKRKYE